MKVQRSATVTLLVLGVVLLSWGPGQAWAQAPLYPPGIGWNPAVNYNLPNFAQSPNLRKFVDSLPGLNAANQNNLGQYIPVAVADTTTYPGSQFYEIAVRQFTEKVHSDMPPTTFWGYCQLNTTDPNVGGINQYLGPVIIARVYDPNSAPFTGTNGGPVRILFHNQLPLIATDPNGLLPNDPTMMGAGMGPTTGVNYTYNRITIPHLHGGRSPWISDGTPHQWVTPAGEATPYQKGASLVNVPDMVGPGKSIPTPAPGDGSATLYWTNQQSARLMFYHDHAFGTTRINPYLGVASDYLLVGPVEEDLIFGTNVTGGNPAAVQILPNNGNLDKSGKGLYTYGIPLVIQDKAFVNDAVTTPPDANFPAAYYTPTSPTATTDPLWYKYVGKAGQKGGALWMGHEYLPVENIYDPTGNTWNGRWDYAPFMNPPMVPTNLTLPSPTIIPESFADTAFVNGTAFPYVELPPEAIRFRILAIGNDRVFNLQWYRADPIRINIVKAGASYSTTPTVTLTGGGGTYTSATANVSKGEIASINVVGARGYFFAPTVTLTGGGGTYTSIRATLVPNSIGTIADIVVKGAQGYTSAPTVTITGGGGGTYTSATATIIPAGAIKSIDVAGASGYTSEPTVTITDGTGTGAQATAVVNTEVKMVDAAPNPDFPSWPADGRDGGVPDPNTMGPSWVLIGNEGGLLAQAAVIPPQPIGFEYNRQVIPLAGVTERSLLLMPAQRADVIVDFSPYKDGDVLILYNDAPAPMPNYWPINDYYTDDPDQTGVGAAPSTPAGFGPNTRTFMQVRIKGTKTTAFVFDANAVIAALPKAFAVGNDKPLVPQMAYNAAFPGFATTDIYGQNTDTSINVSGVPGAITKIKTVAPGNNYAVVPSVVIVGGGGTGATATAGLNPCGGITLLTTGSGYTSAPTVTIGAPGAGGVRATAVATVSGGQVQSIVIDEPGSNYSTTVVPTVTITGGGGTGATASSFVAVANTVGSITVTAGGSGYTHEPVVYIVPAAGSNGMGASAVALIAGAITTTGKNITEGFDPDYGRMDIRLGSTPNPLTPSVGAGFVVGIARYIDPPTEIVNDGELTLWRIGHLGVDSHALHFHLFDVQVINRVDWTNVIKAPYVDEIGWRDTIRTNPMEDIFVAFRPHAPVLPFVIPTSSRLLDPTTPLNSTINFLPVAPPAGIAAVPQLANVVTNFGWEYVWHCHMLGHEENDFMRPMVLIVPPPGAPTGLAVVSSVGSAPLAMTSTWVLPAAGGKISGFTVQRATNTGFTANLVSLNVIGPTLTSYVDNRSSLAGNTTYYYRVAAYNGAGTSAWSNTATVRSAVGPPATTPGPITMGAITRTSIVINWTNTSANMTGYSIQRATNAAFTGATTTVVNTPNITTRTMTGLRRNTTYYFRIAAVNAAGTSAYTTPGVSAKTLP